VAEAAGDAREVVASPTVDGDVVSTAAP